MTKKKRSTVRRNGHQRPAPSDRRPVIYDFDQEEPEELDEEIEAPEIEELPEYATDTDR